MRPSSLLSRTRPPAGSVRRAAALAALLTVATPALANMAEPPAPQTVRAGTVAGEPSGVLRRVAVVEERLRIDLRPLARDGSGLVEASYRVRNDGAAAEATLWFVAEGFTGEGHGVWLDGRPVSSQPVREAALPAEWRAPASTPAPSGGGPLPYQRGRERVIGFRVRLAPGTHELRVRYPATPSVYRTESMMPVWQLAYVLAPARHWGGFGTLDVRVELPRGWSAAAKPGLRREGSTLVGRWRGVPADALAISAQAPEPGAEWRYAVVLVGALVGLWGLARLGRWTGGALGRRGRTGAWAVPLALLAAVVLAGAVLAAWLSVPEWVATAAGPLVNRYVISRMSYGAGFLALLLLPLVALTAFLAMLVPAVRAARRTRAAS